MSLETRDEYEAWKKLCRELRELGIDVNDQNILEDAIQNWGRRYAQLEARKKLDEERGL